jgi:starch synthase
LNDSVENFNEKTLEGTGFKFHDLTPDAIVNTVKWALYTYYKRKDETEMLITRAMGRRFTWEGAADSYEKVFFSAMERRLG